MTPREVFERAHGLVRSYDIRYVECFAEDGALVFPFAPPGMPKRVEGRAAIRDLLAPRHEALRAAGRKILEYENLRVHETHDPEVIVAEFEVDVQGSKRAFIHVLRVRDDQILEQRDYFDSLAMAERLRLT